MFSGDGGENETIKPSRCWLHMRKKTRYLFAGMHLYSTNMTISPEAPMLGVKGEIGEEGSRPCKTKPTYAPSRETS